MLFQKSIILSLLVVTALMIVLTGCEGPEGPQGPPGPAQVYIVGWIENNGSGDSISSCSIDVYYMPEIPHAEINNIQLQYEFDPTVLHNPLRFFNDDLLIDKGDSVKLSVSYIQLDDYPGFAQANIRLPGPFEITLPDTSYDTISLGGSLVFQWTASHGADAYLFSLRIYYYYLDTIGNSRVFRYDLEDLITDTSLNISAVELFPDLATIDSIEYGYGYFNIYAVSGPIQEGDQSNVTGDGFGFFNGWTLGSHITLRVTNSPYPSNEIMEPLNPIQKFIARRTRNFGR